MKIIWTFTLMMIPGVVSSMSVTGYSGGGVNITCKYYEGYKENTKYFCKGEWLSCKDQIRTDIKDKWVNNGRFSLYDDTRSAVFTVTIRNLREEDSGTYHCGVDIPKDIDPSTEVKLKISTGTPQPPSSPPPPPSSSPPPFPSSSSSASSSSSVKTSPFTGVSRPSTTSLASLNTSSGFFLIVPLVLVPLVLIIAGLLFLFLWKKCQSPGGELNSQTEPGKHEVVSHTGCDYEDIKE
ncbi:CMRF35-like molecule [Pimephales promelas]|nr:CMRF35-like molecule [Pimephales promelas]